MISLEGPAVWRVVVDGAADRLATELRTLAAMNTVAVGTSEHAVVVTGMAMDSAARASCAWSTAVGLADLWSGGLVDDTVALVVQVDQVVYRCPGELMVMVADGAGRSVWRAGVHHSISPMV